MVLKARGVMDERVSVMWDAFRLTYSIAATYSAKKWTAKAKFASCKLSARTCTRLGIVVGPYLERGQCTPASTVGESTPPSHVPAADRDDRCCRL